MLTDREMDRHNKTNSHLQQFCTCTPKITCHCTVTLVIWTQEACSQPTSLIHFSIFCPPIKQNNIIFYIIQLLTLLMYRYSTQLFITDKLVNEGTRMFVIFCPTQLHAKHYYFTVLITATCFCRNLRYFLSSGKCSLFPAFHIVEAGRQTC